MYASERPQPTSTSSTVRRSCCSRVRRPIASRRAGSVNGTSSRTKRATSSTRSASRVTSRARHVGTVTVSPSTSKPSRPRMPRCSSAGTSRPMSSLVRAGRSSTTGRAGSSRCASVSPTQRAPLVSTMSCVASRAACSARYGSTPFSQRFDPSVRSPRRSDVLQDRDGLEVRRLEEDARRLGGDLGLLAAHDRRERDRALAVLDHEVARVELAQLAVERAHLLAVVRAPDADDRRRASVS